MEQIQSLFRTLRGSLLITGTTIGAGMLGIPLVTASSGMLGAFVITFLVWAFMLATGLLLLEATLAMPRGANYLSLSKHYLGRSGQYVTGGLFIFLYAFLLIAYFAAGSPLLGGLLGGVIGNPVSETTALILFTAIFGGIVAIGPKSIDRVNLFLSILMFVVLGAFFLLSAGEVNTNPLTQGEFSKLWLAAPVLFGAFGYHNIIPSLVNYMDGDKKVLRNSIILGVSIPFVVYLLWQYLIIGSIPQQVIQETMKQGLPVTFALAEVLQNSTVIILGQLFAFLAIVTSVLGVAFSFVDFLADGFKTKAKGKMRFALTLLTVTPPFIAALVNPKIFDYALGIAGGFGEALLNGVIPIALVASMRYVQNKSSSYTFPLGKMGLGVLLGFALWVVGIEFKHLLSW